jgi:hypothetical protein
MDENTYIKFLLTQLEGIEASAQTVFEEGTEVLTILETAIDSLKAELNGTHFPVGMTAESFRDFLEVQLLPDVKAGNLAPNRDAIGYMDADGFHEYDENDLAYDDGNDDNEDDVPLDDEDILDELVAGVRDVVGLVPDAEGNLTAVGSIDESAAFADELVAQHEEEVGPIEVSDSIMITYTRLDENELTEAEVMSIITHPISVTLAHFGAVQLVEIQSGTADNVKVAVFGVVESGKVNLKTIALGAVAYRGVHPFPGIGSIQAVGSVNFV